jgi:serine/threonine-protein kinase
MADVFLAVARGPAGFNKLAVIKRLRNPDDDALVHMFLDEARLSARLNHPNIVQTYEVGETAGKFFMAMEYLEGQSLQAYNSWSAGAGGGMSDRQAAFIAAQVAKGLHYAHELADYDGTALGVVHRDVSPHNVFLTYRGEVKLLDFGIAKASVNVTHTETGVLKGKLRYMAPEQVAERDVDRRADICALGIVFWEMLARKKLYEGDTLSILNRIGKEEPPLLRTVRPEISAELEAICKKALMRERDQRYATADEMAIDLEKYLRTQDGGIDAELGRQLSEAFASTRETVRKRIGTFLAKVPAADGEHTSLSGLTQDPQLLPLLGEGSGPRAAPPGSSRSDVSVPRPVERDTTGTTAAIRKKSHLGPVLAGAAAVLLLSGIALLGRTRGASPPPVVSPAAAAPPATLTAIPPVETVATPPAPPPPPEIPSASVAAPAPPPPAKPAHASGTPHHTPRSAPAPTPAPSSTPAGPKIRILDDSP